MAVFKKPWQVRFADTDLAGIVFYPRYFEMVNGIVEDWCEEALGWSFRDQMKVDQVALPTVHLEADFIRPSVLGDHLELTLAVASLGHSSCTIRVIATEGSERRFVVRAVLVLTDTVAYKARPFPKEIRAKIAAYREEEESPFG